MRMLPIDREVPGSNFSSELDTHSNSKLFKMEVQNCLAFLVQKYISVKTKIKPLILLVVFDCSACLVIFQQLTI